MPRQARKLSESGYMHLIVRGIGRQIMFEEAADYQRFLSSLERFLRENRGQNLCLLPDGKPSSPAGLRPEGSHAVDDEKAGRKFFPIFQSKI